MQFKNPELLYALFLLLIPIFIHLFQLRRFQKVAFTNVAYLKKATLQTRKSSQLKKWLTLLMRLLALACIILAFAQPFKASDTALNNNKEIILYIDNSFSMQAKGAKGPLLQRTLQELYALPLENEKISWFTNDLTRKDVSLQTFKDEILKVDYSSTQLSPKEVLLKAEQLFSKDQQVEKRLLYLSDFQQKGPFPEVVSGISVEAVQLKAVAISNVSIDTAYIASKTNENLQLTVVLKKIGETPENIPISLYEGNALLAKSAADFSESTETTISFDIKTSGDFNGRIEVSDANLPYDNTLFFNLNVPEKIRVLSINEANSNYLQRLFDHAEFEYTQQVFNSLNYNDIPNQHFIILNEVKNIPTSLVTALKSFADGGGSIFIIPPDNEASNSYNGLLSLLGMGSFSEKIIQEKKITNIVFDHPLFKNVFEKRVVNFQYPSVNSYYKMNALGSSVLRFEGGEPFIFQKNNAYISSTPINAENSNFQNSPLIVPVLYNMAQQSLSLPGLYYTTGRQNDFAISVSLMQDEIVSIEDSIGSFIPLQQTKATKVEITTREEPSRAGIYSITKGDAVLENISFNYGREESMLRYEDPSEWEGVEVHSDIRGLFEAISEANAIHSYWKWFVIFALLFLILEMLILKYFRNESNESHTFTTTKQ